MKGFPLRCTNGFGFIVVVYTSVQQDEFFMLANPMTYGDVTSPTCTSPPVQPLLRAADNATSNPGTPTNHTSGFSRTFERLSLKSRSKNQSFFKFFGRGHGNNSSGVGNGGGHVTSLGGVAQRNGVGTGGKLTSMDDEEFGGEGSSGSDHEDPFSVSYKRIYAIASACLLCNISNLHY